MCVTHLVCCYNPAIVAVLSVMRYVLTVSQVGAMARFEWNLLSVNIHSKSYKVADISHVVMTRS